MATTPPIVAFLAVLMLAACADSGEPTETTQTSAATVEPYASVVTDHDGEWRASVDESDFACADSTEPDRCAAAYQTGSEEAQALYDELSAAHEGELPAEIAELVADTEAAAADYSAAYEAWAATGCVYPLNAHCGADEALAMFEAQGELTRQLDAWKALH